MMTSLAEKKNGGGQKKELRYAHPRCDSDM